MSYYTYFWLREDGTPYYVGKGKGQRCNAKHYHSSPPDKNRILIQEHPTEEDAFAAEIFFIDYYGREDLGTGKLVNRSSGGEGQGGWSEDRKQKFIEEQKKKRLSEHTKKKISETTSRVRKGMKFSEEHKKNIGKSSRIRMLGNTLTKGKPWSAARREAQNKRNHAPERS